jgi:hypothetical protein
VTIVTKNQTITGDWAKMDVKATSSSSAAR